MPKSGNREDDHSVQSDMRYRLDISAVKRPSIRTARLATWIAVPAALLVSGLVVSSASYSAFSATTENPASNWQTGSVILADDDSNAAMFTATKLQPGSTGSHCIKVTSTGNLASTVKLYSASLATTKSLSSWINLTVVQGAGGSFGDCDGFVAQATNSAVFSGTVADFGTHTDFAGGVGVWTPDGLGTDSRVYKVTYTVNASAPNSTQGGSATVGFTWEAQNN